MSLARVYSNFVWRMQAITATDTSPGRGFLFYTPRDFDPDEARGQVRNFTLFWEGSDEDQEPTDIRERIAQHQFTIEVAYSTDYPLDALHQIVLSDRDDILTTLRDTSSYKGTSDTDPTSSIGLYDRVRVRDDFDRGATHTWYLRITWRCTVQETE